MGHNPVWIPHECSIVEGETTNRTTPGEKIEEQCSLLESVNQVAQRCKLPQVVLVNALYGLGQVLTSLVVLWILSLPSGAKGFPGANQVVRTTPKKDRENTVEKKFFGVGKCNVSCFQNLRISVYHKVPPSLPPSLPPFPPPLFLPHLCSTHLRWFSNHNWISLLLDELATNLKMLMATN